MDAVLIAIAWLLGGVIAGLLGGWVLAPILCSVGRCHVCRRRIRYTDQWVLSYRGSTEKEVSLYYCQSCYEHTPTETTLRQRDEAFANA